MRTELAVLTIICLLAAPMRLAAAASDDTWAKLKHITRARTYTIWTRDRTCYNGTITEIDDHSVILKRRDFTLINLDRKNVLRFSDYGAIGGHLVYSGRSSWLDVKEIPLDLKHNTRVYTKSGTKHEGRLSKVIDTEITLLERGKLTVIAKTEIAKVYFDRLRPLSDNEDYLLGELAYLVVLDPKFWSYEMNAGPKIPVLLYDASEPEDDTPLRCKTD